MDISVVSLLATLIVAATPILLASTGELIVEKSGVLNLGVEGMMITGAVIGFIIAVNTQIPIYGFICAAIAGALLSVLFAILTQYLMSNQVATGLGLTMVGLGLSALIGKPYEGIKSPILGPMIFSHDIIVYFSIFVVATVAFVINKTRIGLVLRAVGENQEAAHALGYKVIRIRFLAIMFGGAAAGVGGAYISLARVPQWTEGMTAGAGWIALALVVFASWKPWRVLLGAYLFGGITVLQLNLQAIGVAIPVEILSMSPYLVTIVVLVGISLFGHQTAPGSLARPFHASQ